jgi:predicted ATP-grasp superfamily ATP-dependent carboligase
MKKTINDITVFEYTDLATAEALVELSVEPMQILLGDYPFYWVASREEAEQLVALGYELLPSIPKMNQPSQNLHPASHNRTA